MTNKQTIEVSRALLERLLNAAEWQKLDFDRSQSEFKEEIASTVKEVRALLDKPAQEVKQQGGAVAWIKPDVLATLRKDECCYAFGEQSPKGNFVPLYTEQPAQAEVVLPERDPRFLAVIERACEEFDHCCARSDDPDSAISAHRDLREMLKDLKP